MELCNFTKRIEDHVIYLCFLSVAVGSFGVGGLLGAFSLLALDEKRDRRVISSGYAIDYSLAVVLASQSRSPWLLPVFFALAGYSMTMTNTLANTLLRSAASPTIRGQTVSLFMLVMRGGNGAWRFDHWAVSHLAGRSGCIAGQRDSCTVVTVFCCTLLANT